MQVQIGLKLNKLGEDVRGGLVGQGHETEVSVFVPTSPSLEVGRVFLFHCV